MPPAMVWQRHSVTLTPDCRVLCETQPSLSLPPFSFSFLHYWKATVTSLRALPAQCCQHAAQLDDGSRKPRANVPGVIHAAQTHSKTIIFRQWIFTNPLLQTLTQGSVLSLPRFFSLGTLYSDLRSSFMLWCKNQACFHETIGYMTGNSTSLST